MIISKESVTYSLRNLKQRKSRSLLTIFSIFVGITAIFVFISFGLGLQNYVNELSSKSSADKISIMPKGMGAPGLDESFALTEDDLDAVEKTSGVYIASGIYAKAAEIQQQSTKKYVYLIGYDPDKPLIFELYNDLGLYKGRWLRSGDTDKAIVGYNYMFENKIFSRAIDVNDYIEVQGKKLKVVGIMDSVGNPQDDSQIYVINEEIDSLYPNRTNNYAWIIAKVDISDIKNIVSRVEESLRDERNQDKGKEDFYVQSFDDMIETYTSALDYIVGFIILIAFVSVIVSAINTANTMVTSVLERVKEIGVIKSIGARNSEVLKIFLFESAFLGFVAGCVGVLIGFIITSISDITLHNLGYGFLSPAYSYALFLGCILFATLAGALSGMLPAIRASKIKPVQALRYE